MPFLLNWFERQIYLKKNYAPGPILDWFAPLAFKTVYTSVKLQIFEILDKKGSLSLEEINSEIHGDENCVKTLLDTLCSLGYLVKKNGTYKNSRMTEKWMLTTSEINLTEMLNFFDDAFNRWQNLDQAVLTGRPSIKGNEWFNSHENTWDNYHKNLRTAAKLIAGDIIKHIKLPDNIKKLVDIGGSHGYYSVKMCQKFPSLNAVIFDWKEAKPTALDTINAFAMNERISFVEGDVLSGSPGNDFDAAILFNTIRAFDEDESVIALKKINTYLKKGGILLIADQFCTSLKSNFSRTNALLIVMELINSSKGKPYSSKDVSEMLLSTGFSKPKETLLSRSPGISLLTSYKL